MASKPFYEIGAYVGEVVAQALGKTSTGKPQFVLRFRVLGRPDPKDPHNYIPVQENERTMYRVITEKTTEYLLEDLEVLSYQRTSFGPLDPSHPQHQSFVGQQVEMYCKHENDQNGDLREKWQLSRGASGLKVDPLDQKGVRELDALFGKALKAKVATVLPKPTPIAKQQREASSRPSDDNGPAPFAPEIDESDVPF